MSTHSPLSLERHAVARSTRLRPYWWPVRLSDWSGGRRDGRRGLPEDGEPTHLLHRLASACEQSARREQLRIDVHSAPLVRRLQGVLIELAHAGDAVDELSARLAGTPLEPPERELTTRGPAEAGDPDAVVADRARRRHAAARASVTGAVQSAVQRQQALSVEADLLRAELETLHAVGATRVLETVEHYQRRVHVYLRALVRRHPDRARVVGRFERSVLQPPSWATSPCPWTAPAPPPRHPDERRLALA